MFSLKLFPLKMENFAGCVPFSLQVKAIQIFWTVQSTLIAVIPSYFHHVRFSVGKYRLPSRIIFSVPDVKTKVSVNVNCFVWTFPLMLDTRNGFVWLLVLPCPCNSFWFWNWISDSYYDAANRLKQATTRSLTLVNTLTAIYLYFRFQ